MEINKYTNVFSTAVAKGDLTISGGSSYGLINLYISGVEVA